MDVITSRHGLPAISPTQPLQSVDVNKLSYELTLELERLTQLFTVDTQKLKLISKRFEAELQDGLDKYGSNIVCDCDCYTSVLSLLYGSL